MKQKHRVAGRENNSFLGNVPRSAKRTEGIDEKLNEMVEKLGHIENSLAEIAEYCGMSKQAVHQIQNRALRKIANDHWDLRHELVTPLQEGKELVWYD